jgi:hypothetical protein
VESFLNASGVDRVIVYHHFTDEFSLFRACVAHGLELMPPPDPEQWEHIRRRAPSRPPDTVLTHPRRVPLKPDNHAGSSSDHLSGPDVPLPAAGVPFALESRASRGWVGVERDTNLPAHMLNRRRDVPLAWKTCHVTTRTRQSGLTFNVVERLKPRPPT